MGLGLFVVEDGSGVIDGGTLVLGLELGSKLGACVGLLVDKGIKYTAVGRPVEPAVCEGC